MASVNGQYDGTLTLKKGGITVAWSSVLTVAAMMFARWQAKPEGFEPTGEELSTIGIIVWGVVAGVLSGALRMWQNWRKHKGDGKLPPHLSGFVFVGVLLAAAAIASGGCATTSGDGPAPEREEILAVFLDNLPEVIDFVNVLRVDLEDGSGFDDPAATLGQLGDLLDALELDVRLDVSFEVSRVVAALESLLRLWEGTRTTAEELGEHKAVLFEAAKMLPAPAT